MYVVESQACSVQNSSMMPPKSARDAAQAAYVAMMQRMDRAQNALDQDVYCRKPSQFGEMGAQIQYDVAVTPPGGAVGGGSTTGVPAPGVASPVAAPGAPASPGGLPGSLPGGPASGGGMYGQGGSGAPGRGWIGWQWGAGRGSSPGARRFGPGGGRGGRGAFPGGAGAAGAACGCELAGPAYVPMVQGTPITLPPPAPLTTPQAVAVPATLPVVPPPSTPAVVVLPPAPKVPTWNNICWAMRFGLVDASQFDPAQFVKANRVCNDLGYTGACAPPYDVIMYLQQAKANGTLPHIDLSDDLIASLPPAPAVVGCDAASQRAAGMSGLGRRGVGDYVCKPGTAPASSSAGGAAPSSLWLWLAAGAAVLLAMSGDGSKNRRAA